MKFGTQVRCWRPVIVLEFQPAVSNGERVARESLYFFRAPALPINAARVLESDCSLPFLKGFSLTRDTWAEKIESLERINSIGEMAGLIMFSGSLMRVHTERLKRGSH